MDEHDVKVIPADLNDHRRFIIHFSGNLFNLRENYFEQMRY